MKNRVEYLEVMYAAWWVGAVVVPINSKLHPQEVEWIVCHCEAMLTHANLIAMSLCYFADVDEVRDEDAALYAAPLSHGAGLYNFVHVRRCARHMVPVSGGFDPVEILDLGGQAGPVSLFAATMVKRLVAAAEQGGRDGRVGLH